ncbi:hypothetical protein [Sphingomonas sp. Ant H11]|uniref:hypothetical protein n=1 Tax=Sphingomonas sp. Ant H11 TaxID=1564113 RepID=UPI0012E0AA5A|nr:hypothetical protein [Sphingomonas sp. Ant H11]
MGALVTSNRTIAAGGDDLAGFIEIGGEILCAARRRDRSRDESRTYARRSRRIDDGPQNEPDRQSCDQHDRRNDDGFTLYHDDETRLTVNRIIPDSLTFRKMQIPHNRMKKGPRRHAMIGSALR